MPSKWRWVVLLVSSIVFYASFGLAVLALLIGVSIISFFAGKWIETTNNKNLALKTTLFLFIGYLFVFKYLNFFIGIFEDIYKIFDKKSSFSVIHLLMPIGVSYYIFQVIGYHIDIANSKIKAEKNPLKLMTFFLFFPKILQGPVERSRNIIPQLDEVHPFNYADFADGCRRILWGFFQKTVIADTIANMVNTVYNHPNDYGGFSWLLVVFLFVLQLYFDFLGYTDIALGSAKLLGITMLENFDKPFISKNITEFWRRWHISFSTWISEYIYNPLAINLRDWGKNSTLFVVIFTFTIAGLWHGAGLTFIVFGILHGIALAYEILTKKRRKKWAKKIPKTIYDNGSMLLTFLYVSITFVFFRASNLNEVAHVFSSIFTKMGADISSVLQGKDISKIIFLNQSKIAYFISLGLVFLLMILENKTKGKSYTFLNQKNPILRWFIYICVLTIIAFFGQFHSEAEFIYVNF